ncbi:hypothetical protein [Arthrobacter koreensis]|uniref:hypothetical protein n=1 Tax=Arthrobacter koreensis TaxID=199136 RepID=UPI00380BB901
MVTGPILMLIAVTWFVYRRQIAAWQVCLVMERFKSLPVRDKDEKARDLADTAFPICLMLFGAGALLTGFHILFG